MLPWNLIFSIAFGRGLMFAPFMFGSVGKRRRAMNEHTDPVCGMKVDQRNAAVGMKYRGKIYYFDSEECANIFHQDPEKYNVTSPPVVGPQETGPAIP
jgi:YHS domain-containing protein